MRKEFAKPFENIFVHSAKQMLEFGQLKQCFQIFCITFPFFFYVVQCHCNAVSLLKR